MLERYKGKYRWGVNGQLFDTREEVLKSVGYSVEKPMELSKDKTELTPPDEKPQEVVEEKEEQIVIENPSENKEYKKRRYFKKENIK